ncbi:MAG: restriction endonuclease subunit S [Proteobacteria bacterium]|nr:restriction endonuclease subunit S [Pseudomonadota bacterium]
MQSSINVTNGLELPEGWVYPKLGEILNVNYGKGLKEATRAPGDIPVYGSNGVVGQHSIPFTQGATIIIGRKGTVGAVHFSNSPCWPIDTTYFIDDFHGLNPKYLLYSLRSLNLAERDTSTAIPGLNREDLYSQQIPLPPLPEQKRIVAKVEELLARVNSARKRLAKVKTILKRFRQAVLSAACSGRLTSDWRERNPNIESVEVLLENIQKRRIHLANTPSQKQKLNEIYLYREQGYSDSMPENWKYLALDKLCESFQYGTSKKSEPSGKVAVLRMGNIQNGEIDWNDLAYTSDDEEIEKYKLNAGDILFNRTNSPELVGKTGIYKGERPAIFAGYLIKINNFKELDSRYLNFCLNTNYARDYCSKVKTDGVSQSNINAQKLGKFEVPFCPVKEQQEIVRRVEALFKLANMIERRVTGASLRAGKMTQAILIKAFRGELVPTEAELAPREGRSYEPASELLTRIKKELGNEVKSDPRKRNRIKKGGWATKQIVDI